MPGSTYTPLASLSGIVAVEAASQSVNEDLWARLRKYGAHYDTEINRLWARAVDPTSRTDRDIARLWQRLAEYGATSDAEVRRLWGLNFT